MLASIESASIALCYIISHYTIVLDKATATCPRRHLSCVTLGMKQFAQEYASKYMPSQGYIPTPDIGCLFLETHQALDGMDTVNGYRTRFERI